MNEQTWASINCAFARLSQIVGLHRVVDTVYRMAHSPYLYEGQTDRVPIQPYAWFATGANAMRPLDMAAGMQTIANQGLHHDPYYVDYIEERRRHPLVHARRPGRAGARSRRCAHRPCRHAEGRARRRAPPRKPLANFPSCRRQDRHAAGQHQLVVRRRTPQLTTAVWVGDPDGYTPMINIPSSSASDKVQGGTYPARIWGALMEPRIGTAAVGGLGRAARAGAQAGASVPAGQRVPRQARQWRAAGWTDDDHGGAAPENPDETVPRQSHHPGQC